MGILDSILKRGASASKPLVSAPKVVRGPNGRFASNAALENAAHKMNWNRSNPSERVIRRSSMPEMKTGSGFRAWNRGQQTRASQASRGADRIKNPRLAELHAIREGRARDAMGPAGGTAGSFYGHLTKAMNNGGMKTAAKYAKYGAALGAISGAATSVGQAIDPDAVQSTGMVRNGIRGALLGATLGAMPSLGSALSKTQSANKAVQGMVNGLGGHVKTVGNHWLAKGAIGASIVASSGSVHLTSPVNRVRNR